MKLASITLFFCFGLFLLLGCSGREKVKPFNLQCNNYFLLHESFNLLLGSVDQKNFTLLKHKQIVPENQVIFAAHYNCENGVLAYVTQKRMVASSRSILHLVYENHQEEYVFEQGAVTLLPYGKDEIIIGTTLLKRADYDSSLGDPDAFEYIGASSLNHYLSAAFNETMFTESVIFNLKTKVSRKVVYGEQAARYQAGKYLIYTYLNRLVEFYPETGKRNVLFRYDNADLKGKNIPEVAYSGQLFHVENQLLLVNYKISAGFSDASKPLKMLPEYSIFRFFPESGWQTIEEFKDRIYAGFLSNNMLFVLGGDAMGVYKPKEASFLKHSIPVKGVSWVGGSHIYDENTLLLTGLKGDSLFLYAVKKDFSEVLMQAEVPGFSWAAKLQTAFVPDPLWRSGW